MSLVETKFIVVSDTHGQPLTSHPITDAVDVAIHCGDLTDESNIDELKLTLQYLRDLKADLKLVIAGNHDFTLDVPAFQKLIQNAIPPLETELVQKTYGEYGEARRLMESAKSDNIVFLGEGTHTFNLRIGTSLRVYASPYTPSQSGDWGFQYHPDQGRSFDIPENVDVVITHGPPLGVLDYTASRQRAGCPELFQAVARAKPRLHCFGHIHEAWGAKLVTWRDTLCPIPSHFTDINNSKSTVLGNVSQLSDARQNGDVAFFSASCDMQTPVQQTLFVNAALQSMSGTNQVPWLIEVPLPKTGV